MRLRTAATLAAVAILAAGCGLVTDSERDVILGSGVITSERIEVPSFDRIEFASEGRVLISSATEPSLVLSADDNLHQYIEASVRGTTLWIRTAHNTDIDPSDSMVFRVGVADLQSVEVTGVAGVEIGTLVRGAFSIELSGVGDVDIEALETDRLSVSASGVGDIRIAGTTATADVDISGPAGYHALDLQTRETSVAISGPGEATVWATELLTVSISSTGLVRYAGNPVLAPSITGTGSIEQIER